MIEERLDALKAELANKKDIFMRGTADASSVDHYYNRMAA